MKKENQDQVRDYYSKAQFWDQRYVQKGSFFDWYAQYPQLKYAFQSQYGMSKDDSILMVGCGNSKLSQQMFEVGYKNIVNIDISPRVIQQMKQVSPDMQWLVMDATAMTFESKIFDYVIDKGTMDALIAGRDLTPTFNLLQECMRVTKEEGQIILITYGSPQGRKKVYETSLPFQIYDYYFAYINLNDMSTMINLMRNNLIGSDEQKVSKEEALQRSMKEFMMIKIMRQRRSKQKQFIVWQNFEKKSQLVEEQSVQNKSTISETRQPSNQNDNQKPQLISNQQSKSNTVDNTVPTEQKQSIKDEPQKPKQTTIKYMSKSQKQSFVYAYSIKRKFGYSFNLENYKQSFTQSSYQGNQKMTSFEIKANTNLNQVLGMCIQYLKENAIAFSSIQLKTENDKFSSNQKNVKFYLKNGERVGLKLLKKTNIDLKVTFMDFNEFSKKMSKLENHLVQNFGLQLQPCPKTYSLFTILKGKMKAKSVNELLKRYWYPTYRFTNINIKQGYAQISLSVPPILQSILFKVKQSIKQYFDKSKQITMQVFGSRNGYVTYPQLNLFGILNMGSLSYDSGKGLNVFMQQFWQGNSQSVDSSDSKFFIVDKSHVEVPQRLLPHVLMHILALY